jgi:glutathione synthase
MDMLPDWPPTATQLDISDLLTDARDYALSHSILYRPVEPSATSAIHAPFALFPSPFPKKLYDRVVRLQTAYNELYAEIASDHAFLEKVIGGNVIKVDDFQERLYRIWIKVREDGEAQPLQLGLFRSDYLLHSPPSSSSSPTSSELHIKQVEFNTISSSFGGLSSKVTELHR